MNSESTTHKRRKGKKMQMYKVTVSNGKFADTVLYVPADTIANAVYASGAMFAEKITAEVLNEWVYRPEQKAATLGKIG